MRKALFMVVTAFLFGPSAHAADSLICGPPYGKTNGAPIGNALKDVKPSTAADLCAAIPSGSEVDSLRCTTKTASEHGYFFGCQIGTSCHDSGTFASPVRSKLKDLDSICIHYENKGSQVHNTSLFIKIKKRS
ncbi:hypothetical protein N1937_25640 (plasmid) [Rhizobium sp. WSM4643]|uniref:hypothetical protein n=1 Tax=Rhizobium sp. WSM4643 TaxID=3138253 RepID=UPI0021A8A07D|nr:hypothetical protein [Rhizobium leguminosarum]UWM78159.1 hypothetical protein N1937_25640 [Rhizobium leguminosarum bv. viciae]